MPERNRKRVRARLREKKKERESEIRNEMQLAPRSNHGRIRRKMDRFFIEAKKKKHFKKSWKNLKDSCCYCPQGHLKITATLCAATFSLTTLTMHDNSQHNSM